MTLTVFDNLDDVAPIWEDFAHQVPGFVYQQFAWCQSWYETIGQPGGYQLHIILVHNENGQVVMLAPLCIKKGRLSKVAVFMGEGISDYLAPLIRPDFAAHLAKTGFDPLWQEILASFDAPVDLVWFDRQPEKILDMANPFYQLAGSPFESKAYALKLPEAENWHQAARKVRSNKTAKKIERRFRALEKIGDVKLVESRALNDKLCHFDKLLTLKIDNLNEAGILHRMDTPEVEAFYRRIVASPEMTEKLVQFELHCGDRMVATVLGFIAGNRFYYQICAFNRREFGRYSPGLLLLYKLFDWSFEHGLASFDMTIGDEAYKADWSNETTRLKNVAQAVSLGGRLQLAKRRAFLAFKKAVKSTPALAAIAIKLLK